jgi:glycosyltransferase involved in cell wall biosynthesis
MTASLDSPALPRLARPVAVERLRVVLATLAPHSGPTAEAALPAALARALEPADAERTWLALAVLAARFPVSADLDQAQRTIRLDGADAVVARALAELETATEAGLPRAFVAVEVVDEQVAVDVHHTSSAEYVSGIQRVVREAALRWRAVHAPLFIGWTDGYGAWRRLTDEESAWMFGPSAAGPTAERAVALVPWRCTYVLPELGAEPDRSARLLALARYSAVQVAAIGHDIIPVTSADTVVTGMSGLFVSYLAALRHAQRIATTSVASTQEFVGWRRMARAAGFAGPDVGEVQLPVHARVSDTDDVAVAARRLTIPGSHLVLVVGSHEPRKNHLTVLQAAELLWREGLRFNLAFVGTGSWAAERFNRRLAELRAGGRPVETVVGLSDPVLWAAYGLARCVVFPSLSEGFGLPVAEALAAGTPVVTSDFGSMREIVAPAGEPVGGVLVDPRDDRAVADGLRRLLADGPAYERIAAQARSRSRRTWDEYASQTWDYLVSGVSPLTTK